MCRQWLQVLSGSGWFVSKRSTLYELSIKQQKVTQMLANYIRCLESQQFRKQWCEKLQSVHTDAKQTRCSLQDCRDSERLAKSGYAETIQRSHLLERYTKTRLCTLIRALRLCLLRRNLCKMSSPESQLNSLCILLLLVCPCQVVNAS